jgi:glycosyltransferase involved in cell wall biosynthesis
VVHSPLATLATPVRAGNRVIIFQRQPERDLAAEKLSIIMPVFNEARYCQRIIETVLAKRLPIDKELIIVESNSTDGSREIVQSFDGRPGVRVVLQDRPRGKGFAVRAGLEAATGTIILIQDADFEYDVDDYDALLEPILQHRAAFVLGSRSLGLDDWKVRKFGQDRLKGLVLNAAQVSFAQTFNVLYQQKVTDVNTMFKVFRTECLDGINLEGDGFELDIELVCRLTKNGYSPMEVPVNYIARGFAEGKKIKFGRESVLSYLAFLRYRFKK